MSEMLCNALIISPNQQSRSEDSGLCRQCQKSMTAKGLRPRPRYRQVRILSLQLSINYLHKMSNHATNTRLPQDAVKILREWHKEHWTFHILPLKRRLN
jgi:hypothetical protein